MARLTTHQAGGRPAPASSHSMGRRTGLAVVAALVAASAFGGALALGTGSLALQGDLNERLPLHSPAVGSLLLALIVGLPFTVLAVAAWQGVDGTDTWAVGAGVVLIGWIVAELAFIREVSFFHPLYIAVGALFMVAGRRALDRERGRHSRR